MKQLIYLTAVAVIVLQLACGGGNAGGSGGGGGDGGGGGGGNGGTTPHIAWLQEVSGSTFVFQPMLGTYQNGQLTSKAVLTQNAYESIALSPDGTKVVYSSAGIYSANVDGTNVKLLQGDGQDPQWSPDGTKIAFTALAGGAWIMNADGSNQHLMMSGAYYPKFSVDGATIVAHMNAGIATFDTSGGNFKQLTTQRTTDANGSSYYDLMPGYTKAGHIIFGRSTTRCDVYWCYDPYIDMMMMNADGTNVHSVVAAIGSDVVYLEPTLAHNGSVMFASNVDVGNINGFMNLDIYALTFAKSDESDTPTITRLTNNTLFDAFCSYLYGSSGWGPVP